MTQAPINLALLSKSKQFYGLDAGLWRIFKQYDNTSTEKAAWLVIYDFKKDENLNKLCISMQWFLN